MFGRKGSEMFSPKLFKWKNYALAQLCSPRNSTKNKSSSIKQAFNVRLISEWRHPCANAIAIVLFIWVAIFSYMVEKGHYCQKVSAPWPIFNDVNEIDLIVCSIWCLHIVFVTGEWCFKISWWKLRGMCSTDYRSLLQSIVYTSACQCHGKRHFVRKMAVIVSRLFGGNVQRKRKVIWRMCEQAFMVSRWHLCFQSCTCNAPLLMQQSIPINGLAVRFFFYSHFWLLFIHFPFFQRSSFFCGTVNGKHHHLILFSIKMCSQHYY